MSLDYWITQFYNLQNFLTLVFSASTSRFLWTLFSCTDGILRLIIVPFLKNKKRWYLPCYYVNSIIVVTVILYRTGTVVVQHELEISTSINFQKLTQSKRTTWMLIILCSLVERVKTTNSYSNRVYYYIWLSQYSSYRDHLYNIHYSIMHKWMLVLCCVKSQYTIITIALQLLYYNGTILCIVYVYYIYINTMYILTYTRPWTM